MTPAARRFTSTLLLASGPVLVVYGFLAAFTLDGAVCVFLGLSLLLSGLLLRTRLPLVAAVLVGIGVFAMLVANMILEFRG